MIGTFIHVLVTFFDHTWTLMVSVPLLLWVAVIGVMVMAAVLGLYGIPGRNRSRKPAPHVHKME